MLQGCICLFIILAVYQIGKVWDSSMPYLVCISLLACHEVPALVILYISNSHQPVYLGSLKIYFYGYGVSEYIVYTFFLIFEILMICAAAFNCMLYGFIYIVVMKASIFWMDEMV